MGNVVRATEQGQGLGFAAFRPWKVFWSFDSLFESMRSNWSWGWAYLYAVAGLTVANLLTLPSTLALTDEKLAAAQPSDSMLHAVHIGLTISTFISPLITPLLKTYLMAFVALLFGALFSVKARFTKLFALLLYSYLPLYTVGSLVTALVMRQVSPEAMPHVSFSAAVVLGPALTGTTLDLILKTLDVFSLWSLGLFVIGYRSIHRVSWQKAIAVGSGLLALMLVQTLLVGARAS